VASVATIAPVVVNMLSLVATTMASSRALQYN